MVLTQWQLQGLTMDGSWPFYSCELIKGYMTDLIAD